MEWLITATNVVLAFVSIGLGAIGWLAPRYTMDLLDVKPGASSMGMSETRAASGALFVGLGVGALVLATPTAFAMVGFAWGFAALGRLTSALLDPAPIPRVWIFFATEAVVAALLLSLNLGAAYA